jgi:hypothetical protein
MSRAAIPLQLAGDAGDVDAAVSATQFWIRQTKNGDGDGDGPSSRSTIEAVGIDARCCGGEL